MNSYESMVIVSANLQESDVAQENLKILNYIKDLGGEIKETDEWGKMTLAYEIQKQKEGFYFINYFLLSAEKVHELDRFYRLNENIIRHNIIKK